MEKITEEEKLKYQSKCTTCAEQCAEHGGGYAFNNGCLCHDGTFKECKKKKDQ